MKFLLHDNKLTFYAVCIFSIILFYTASFLMMKYKRNVFALDELFINSIFFTFIILGIIPLIIMIMLIDDANVFNTYKYIFSEYFTITIDNEVYSVYIYKMKEDINNICYSFKEYNTNDILYGLNVEECKFYENAKMNFVILEIIYIYNIIYLVIILYICYMNFKNNY